MEARATYGPWRERPRLTVVKDGPATYSALPHAVLFSGLSDGAVRLYAVLQSHWWGESGECTASHATLAAEAGKKERSIRRLLDELTVAGVVAERHLGRGQAKAYRPSEPDPSGQKWPVPSGQNLPVGEPKRPNLAKQAAKNGQFKRPKMAAPIKKTPVKKKKEEDRNRSNERLPTRSTAQSRVIDLIVAGGAPSPTFGGRAGKAIKDTGADPEIVAAAYLAVWHGAWGDDWLRDNLSLHAVVDRLDGFKVWQREQALPVEHVNGTGSKLTPATDGDREVWDRARSQLAATMNAANFEGSIAPLIVAGRGVDGGLRLLVNPLVVPHLAGFRHHISRALEDAGDEKPLAVAFVARRPAQESHHAE